MSVSEQKVVRLGRSLLIEGLVFAGFPQDGGLWWLRWWDYGAATSTSKSSILHLLFSKLPDGTRADALPFLDAQLARGGTHFRAEVHVGWLPVLRIGLVVQAGAVIGRLGAQVRRFSFDSEQHQERVELLLNADFDTVSKRRRRRLMTSTAEPLIEFGDQPGFLRPELYPLPTVRDGRLLCFGSKKPGTDPELMLPCAEIVRVGYAPHASLARAVIDNSWSRGMSRVLKMNLTENLADGSGWQIAPRVRLRSEHFAVAANLALSMVGRRRANLIYNELHTEGVLTALLPFQWRYLQMDVACISLDGHEEERWFGYSIESLQWPPAPFGPPGKLLLVPNEDRRKGQRQPGVAKVGSRSIGAGSGSGSSRTRTRVVRNADPVAAGQFHVLSEGPAWLNSPAIVKVDKSVSFSPAGDVKASKITTSYAPELISAAEPGRARTGPKSADPQSSAPEQLASLPSDHFQDVLEMLQSLVSIGALESVGIVGASGAELEMRGNVAAWGVPSIPVLRKSPEHPLRRWFIRDFPRKLSTGKYSEPVRRAAMICRVVVDGKTLHWIEIEPRFYLRDNYRSLIFSVTGTAQLRLIIMGLLAVAAERAGVWPNAARLSRRSINAEMVGVGPSTDWEHVRIRPTIAGPNHRAPLSGNDALLRLKSLLRDL